MGGTRSQNFGNSFSRARRTTAACTFLVALSACGAAKVGGVVSAIGGAASSVGGAVVGGAGKVAKGAADLATSGADPATAARPASELGASGASFEQAIPPTVLAASSAAANDPTDVNGDPQGAKISKGIIAGLLYCVRLEKEEYRIDCYADQLDQVSKTIPDDPDLGETRSILSGTAQKLSEVVQKRASKSLGPVSLTSNDASKRGSKRTILAVATEQLPMAYAEAEQILEEAKTLLLRAAETSQRRKLAYLQVAETVGSTKVLLRST